MIMESKTMMTSTQAAQYPSSSKELDAEEKVHAAATSDAVVTHEYLKECLEEFVTLTQDARMMSERCRDYYDGKQWTAEQIQQLKKRKQAPIVNNRIKVKLNGLLGLTSVRKGDPKAYPRNVEHDSQAAEAVTDGLRYAADKIAIQSTFLECADTFFCEGYTGVNIVLEQTPKGDMEVVVDHIPWDRIFFDPYSRKHDFSDARGKGFGLWMDEEDIIATFPDANPDALQEMQLMGDETLQDKPSWVIKTKHRRRFLVITHYIKYKNVWTLAIYTGGGFLVEPMPSPYTDEYGQPECPLELEHAYVDRDNNRYGELASFLDLQDEINHRRSKALFLLSQRQTFGNRGSVTDVKKAKRELAKPDGHLEVGQGEFNKDFGVLPTGDMAQGQFELLQEAKQEIDAQSYNAQLAGERSAGELSGVALQRLQQAGVTELIKLFENFGAFKLRVYKQMWNRIRQGWDKEKWVRVTDDETKLRWVGFNVPITLGKMLQETMDDESKPYEMRLGASATLTQLEQQNPDALAQLVETKNPPAEMDMDIILDESYDTINVSQEQLDAILKFGAQNAFDIVDLLEISNITGKDKMIEKINNRKKSAAEAPPDAQSQYLMGKAQEAAASTKAKEADAQQTMVETQILQNTPPQAIPIKGSMSA